MEGESGRKIFRENVLLLLGIDKGKWRFTDLIEETNITDIDELADTIDFFVSKKIFSRTDNEEKNPQKWVIRNDYKKINFNISTIPSKYEMKIYEGVEFNKNYTIYGLSTDEKPNIFDMDMFDIQGRLICRFKLIQSLFDDFVYTSTFEWWKLNNEKETTYEDEKHQSESQEKVDKETTVILKRMKDGDDLLFLCINGMTHFKVFMKKESNVIFSCALWWCSSKTIKRIPVYNSEILFDNKKSRNHENNYNNNHGGDNRSNNNNRGGFSRGYSRDESSDRGYQNGNGGFHKRGYRGNGGSGDNRKGGSHPYKKYNNDKN